LKDLENTTRRGLVSKYASVTKHSINDNEISNILEIQRLRADILKQAFNSSAKVVNLFEIGGPLGIRKEKLERIYFYLQDEGLIDFYALGGDFILTEKGREMLKKNLKRIL
jgi:predicted transcriptional regulator